MQYRKGKPNIWSLHTLSASWLHHDPPHLLGTKNRARKSLLGFYCSFVLFCFVWQYLSLPNEIDVLSTLFSSHFSLFLSWLYWYVSHLLDLSAFVWQPRMDDRQWLAAARPPHSVLSFTSQHMQPTTHAAEPRQGALVLSTLLWAGEPSSSLSPVLQANLRETAKALKPFM